MKVRSLAALAAIVTASSGLVVATPVGAAPPPSLALYSSTITVHTSNGKAWQFGLSTSQLGPTDQLDLHLTRSAAGGAESHYWTVPSTSPLVTFNQATGQGTLKTPSSTAALTTVNMTFKATRHHNASCISGSETVYVGNLTGRATLITHMTGGGTVGGQHLAFTAGTTSLYADNGCIPSFPTNNQCFKSASYSASSPNARSLFGYGGGSSSFIQVSHNVSITNPAGTTREDTASATSASAPVFDKTAKSMKVTGSTSGLVTGSGRIVASKLSHSTRSCKLAGKTYTEDQFISSGAKFTNTTGHPIVGHTILTGRLTIASGGNADFDVETWH